MFQDTLSNCVYNSKITILHNDIKVDNVVIDTHTHNCMLIDYEFAHTRAWSVSEHVARRIFFIQKLWTTTTPMIGSCQMTSLSSMEKAILSRALGCLCLTQFANLQRIIILFHTQPAFFFKRNVTNFLK